MQEKRLSRILGIYRSNPSGSVLKVWKSYPESFYKKLVNKRFFLKIRDNPTFGITNFVLTFVRRWKIYIFRKIGKAVFSEKSQCAVTPAVLAIPEIL